MKTFLWNAKFILDYLYFGQLQFGLTILHLHNLPSPFHAAKWPTLSMHIPADPLPYILTLFSFLSTIPLLFLPRACACVCVCAQETRGVCTKSLFFILLWIVLHMDLHALTHTHPHAHTCCISRLWGTFSSLIIPRSTSHPPSLPLSTPSRLRPFVRSFICLFVCLSVCHSQTSELASFSLAYNHLTYKKAYWFWSFEKNISTLKLKSSIEFQCVILQKNNRVIEPAIKSYFVSRFFFFEWILSFVENWRSVVSLCRNCKLTFVKRNKLF